MGRLHRRAYALFGLAALSWAVIAESPGLVVRILVALAGASALFSSFTGFCITCHLLKVTTRGDRIERIS
jgi:hypothetical protein